VSLAAGAGAEESMRAFGTESGRSVSVDWCFPGRYAWRRCLLELRVFLFGLEINGNAGLGASGGVGLKRIGASHAQGTIPASPASGSYSWTERRKFCDH
jgi:hypothetical protein